MFGFNDALARSSMTTTGVQVSTATDSASVTNQYHAFIVFTGDNVRCMQRLYLQDIESRTSRQEQAHTRLITSNSSHANEVSAHPRDEGHNIALHAMLPRRLQNLMKLIQQMLQEAAPKLYIVPEADMHVPVLEIARYQTRNEIEKIISQAKPHLAEILNYPRQHRARLHTPTLSYDDQEVRVTFVPAAYETLPKARMSTADNFTFHHLQRDLFNLLKTADVNVDNQIEVAPAHVVIARFVNEQGLHTFEDNNEQRRADFRDSVELAAEWLRREYGIQIPGGAGMQWQVGEARGLQCVVRKSRYGQSEVVMQGDGF